MKFIAYILVIVICASVWWKCTMNPVYVDSPKSDIVKCSGVIFKGYGKDYVFKLLSGSWLLQDSTRLIIYGNGEFYHLTYDKWVISKSLFQYGFYGTELFLDANICNPFCGKVAFCDDILVNTETDFRAVLITKEVK